jgi:4-amino-4-deoxy-L-arabinose transferase-like glycosyltransferase
VTTVEGPAHIGLLDHGHPGMDAVVVSVPADGTQAAERDAGLDAGRVRLALAAILSLTALLTIWGLDRNGYANTYYAAAAQAAAADWRAMFFGALDAPGWITIDKPPLSIWVMGVSVRLFGLSAWSLLLPQALMGVATVGILFAAVRRWAGARAGLLAALVLALTPVAVLIFRFDDPDALLTLLLVAAASALVRGIDSGRLGWLLFSGILVGMGFETKFLQAFLVLPAFGLVLLVGGAGSLAHRIGSLLAAGIATFVASFWWVAVVEAIPLAQRPFTGGSATGGPLDLLLGYDGLGRILGEGAGGSAGAFGGAGSLFGGPAGPFRLLGTPWDGGIGWLLPLAMVLTAIGVCLALRQARRAGRQDRQLLGYLLWGGWLVTHTLVFSLMSGIVHSYYAVTLAPAVAATVGMGVIDLWAWRGRSALGGVILGLCIVGTAWWSNRVLSSMPGSLPWLGSLVLALGVVGGLLVAAPRSWSARAGEAAVRRTGRIGLACGLAAVLLGPAAWSLATASTAQTGGDPVPGPVEAGQVGFGGFIRGGLARGFGARPVPGADVGRNGLATWLLAHQTTEDWIAATSGATDAASLQLAAGRPVMAMGGFIGSDPSPTLAQLQALVAEDRLRYVLLPSGRGIGGFLGGSNNRTRDGWVRATCVAVTDPSLGGSAGQRASLYDCAPGRTGSVAIPSMRHRWAQSEIEPSAG